MLCIEPGFCNLRTCSCDSSDQTGKFSLVKDDGRGRFTLATDHGAPGDGTGDQKQETGEGKETEDEKQEIKDENDESENKEENEEKGEGSGGVEAQAEGNRRGSKITADWTEDERQEVREAVLAIDNARYSVFSYAILSGKMDAVQFIYDLVVNLFSGLSQKVREFTGWRCFQNGTCWRV